MSSVSRRLSVVTGIVATLAASEARGDELTGTRGGEMLEKAHSVELRVDRGYATMVVRRTVHNPTESPDEAVYELWLPAAAVATGLRVRGGSRWWGGRSLDAQVASDRYHALTDVDERRALDAHAGPVALLAWRDESSMTWRSPELELRVFPVGAGRTRTVEYTFEMPMTWSGGRWRLPLESIGADEPAVMSVRSVVEGDRLFLGDEEVSQGHRLVLDDNFDLALAPRVRAVATLELATLPTGGDDMFVHYRVSLGDELMPAPRGARVVIALDASRSLAPTTDDTQRQAALAYLTQLRAQRLGARVLLLAFDRRVRTLGDGWLTADGAIKTLAAAPLDLDNGSDVALALREAGRRLADAPAGAPRRVLVLTDFMTASSASLEQAEAAAASTGAIVHLADVEDRRPALQRDDEHAWASVAARTTGVVWRAATPSSVDAEVRAEAAEVFAEWVRPVRVDALTLSLGHLEREPGALDAGESHEERVLVDGPVDVLTVRGSLWNIPFVRTTRRSASLSRRWAALLFGDPLFGQLEVRERAYLAARSGAVTEFTSLLAASPEAAPTSAGIRRERPVLGVGLVGKGGGGGTGSGDGRAPVDRFSGRLDRAAWLQRELTDRWHACGGAGRGARLELETTREELVDFSLASPGPTRVALIVCMREATWGLWLPASDFFEERARWSVVIPATRP